MSIERHTLSLAAFLAALMAVGSGCAPELSTIPGVSVKEARHGHVACYDDARGNHREEGWTLAQHLVAHNPGLSVVSAVELSTRYDIIVSGAQKSNWPQLLPRILRECFGLRAEIETRPTDVLVLARKQGAAFLARPSKGAPSPRCKIVSPVAYRRGLFCGSVEILYPARYAFTGYSMSTLAGRLERELTNRIVVEETQCHGLFDFQIAVKDGTEAAWQQGVRRLGLELKPAQRAVRAVFVDPPPGREPAAPAGNAARTSWVYPRRD